MRVKRFVAGSIQEAIIKVKTELGKDAVILHTRKFKEGGFLGFFCREMVEVTAAVDGGVGLKENKLVGNYPKEELRPFLPVIEEPPRNSEILEQSPKEKTGRDPLIQAELQEMKNMMTQVLKEVERSSGAASFPPAVEQAFCRLRNQEVDEDLARQLVKSVSDRLSSKDLANLRKVQECLENLILELLPEPDPIQVNSGEIQKVVFLVGPTGVGKTTTLAKLAAHFSLIERKRIALITIDTYRIAAIQQLKTYGKIIGIPVEVVFTPENLQVALNRHRDKELILVDTAGRSPQNNAHLDELKAFIDQCHSYENYLVLSACTRYQDMVKIYDSFSIIPLHKLMFTKLDETEVFGSLLNMVSYSQKRLSYVTIGQNVPDDIEIPDSRNLARMIVGQIEESSHE